MKKIALVMDLNNIRYMDVGQKVIDPAMKEMIVHLYGTHDCKK